MGKYGEQLALFSDKSPAFWPVATLPRVCKCPKDHRILNTDTTCPWCGGIWTRV